MAREARLIDFASEIGGAEMSGGVDPGEGVVFDWTQWNSLPAAGPGWTLIYTGLQHQPPSASRKFDFRRDQEELSLEVFVSGDGSLSAWQHLREIGTNTAMASSPYKRGPGNLGDLSLVPRSGPANSIAWAYRNVCFHLEIAHSPFDLMALAYALQKQAALHLVRDIDHDAPAPASLVARPQTAALGEVITVALDGAGTLDATKLDIDFRLEGEGLRAEAQDGLSLTFKAVKTGTTRIWLQVTDKQTLLSRLATTSVTIVPPRSP